MRIIPVILLLMGLIPCTTSACQIDVEKQQPAKTAIGIDYLHFWLMRRAQRLDSIESVYHVDEHEAVIAYARELAESQNSDRLKSHLAQNRVLYETGLEPTGSPFFYGLFGMMQTGRYEIDFWIFQVVSSLLFVGGVCLLGRIGNLNVAICLLICLGLVIVFRPLRVDFLVANTNRIQVFIFTVVAWLLSKQKPAFFSAGIAMGLAVAFKLNFAVVPIFLLGGCLVDRRWVAARNIVLGSVAGLAAGLIAGELMFDSYFFGTSNHWQLWHAYVADMLASPYPAELGNYSMIGLWNSRIEMLPEACLALFWIVSCLSVATGKHVTGNRRHSSLPLWGAMGLLVFLMSSPLVWSHYFVLAIPCFVLTLATCEFRGVVPMLMHPTTFILIASIVIFAIASSPLAGIISASWITGLLQTGTLLLFGSALTSMIGSDFSNSNSENSSSPE